MLAYYAGYKQVVADSPLREVFEADLIASGHLSEDGATLTKAGSEWFEYACCYQAARERKRASARQ